MQEFIKGIKILKEIKNKYYSVSTSISVATEEFRNYEHMPEMRVAVLTGEILKEIVGYREIEICLPGGTRVFISRRGIESYKGEYHSLENAMHHYNIDALVWFVDVFERAIKELKRTKEEEKKDEKTKKAIEKINQLLNKKE